VQVQDAGLLGAAAVSELLEGAAVVPWMASRLTFIQSPMAASRSMLGAGIRPALVGPTLSR